MTLMPFSLFQVNFRFELSHFEMDIEKEQDNDKENEEDKEDKYEQKKKGKDKRHIIVRYNFHQHDRQVEMLGYKFGAKDQFDLKIATGCGEVEFPVEEKVDKIDSSNNLKYYPTSSFTIKLYKEPFPVIINAYFPMLVLALLGLMIFK